MVLLPLLSRHIWAKNTPFFFPPAAKQTPPQKSGTQKRGAASRTVPTTGGAKTGFTGEMCASATYHHLFFTHWFPRSPSCLECNSEALARRPQPMPSTHTVFFFFPSTFLGLTGPRRRRGQKDTPTFNHPWRGYDPANLLN